MYGWSGDLKIFLKEKFTVFDKETILSEDRSLWLKGLRALYDELSSNWSTICCQAKKSVGIQNQIADY